MAFECWRRRGGSRRIHLKARSIRAWLPCSPWSAVPTLTGKPWGSCTATGTVHPRMVTLFSVECGPYFDWQTVGLMHSYRRSKQPGPITRLLSCTEKQLKDYPNMDLAPTHTVPSMSLDPKTGEWYPAINKPYGVWHWVQHSPQAQQAEWVVILDADMVIRAPVTPWGVKAEKGKPVAAYYGYLIGCDNILAELHTKHPELCPKVGGFIVMHIDDLRRFVPLWLSKTHEVRADKAHYARNITGDVYSSGWISEMYGYSFGAADAELHHQVDQTTMLYPGYTPTPGVDPRLLHYGLAFSVGNWSFGKSQHRTDKIVNECNRLFDPPPFASEVRHSVQWGQALKVREKVNPIGRLELRQVASLHG
ncbi:unnamed protein product [Closterium sp. NIES-54]